VGCGLVSDAGLVASVSREGDRRELLKGPLFYVLVLIACTLLSWRDSPTGLVAVSMMCGGDGMADIVGRRFGGGNRLPWNGAKSVAGSAAMLVGGCLMSLGWVWGCVVWGVSEGRAHFSGAFGLCSVWWLYLWEWGEGGFLASVVGMGCVCVG